MTLSLSNLLVHGTILYSFVTVLGRKKLLKAARVAMSDCCDLEMVFDDCHWHYIFKQT